MNLKNVNLKLAVIGEGKVGKTSLVNSFLGKEIPSSYSPTINSKVSKKDYKLKKTGVVFKINIWDVGGNRLVNPNFNKAFVSDVDLALIVFDLARPEETLETHKKNYLDKINYYSEEPLTLIVGNKLDKLSLNNEFKEAIENYLGEKTRFSITSVISELNVDNCFELLLYTFLKKGEILIPDIVPENSASEFIELIGKNEKELRSQLVNLTSIASKYRELKSKIKTIDESPKKRDKEEKYYEYIQQELHKMSIQKSALVDNFFKNITDVEKKITQLKKGSIKSATELVDKLKISLESSRKDCEQNLEALLKLNREENELMIISSKIKEDKLEAKLKEKPSIKKVEEAKVDITPKEKPIKIKPLEVKVDATPKPKPSPLKIEEVKVDITPKEKPIKAKLPEIKVDATLKVKPSPLKIEEVKVDITPKEKPIKIKLPEVKVDATPKPKPSPLKIEEVKVDITPKEKPVKIKLPEVKVDATPKVKPSPLKIEEVKVDIIPKEKPVKIKLPEVKVDATSKVKPSPLKIEEVKVDITPKEKLIKTKLPEIKVDVTPKAKASPLKLKKVKVDTTPKPKPKPRPSPLTLKKVKVDTTPKPKPKPRPSPLTLKKVKVDTTPKPKPKPKPSPLKLKKIKIAATPIKKDKKIELYNKYEKENPGKRAVYRGKATKGFLAWKKQNS